MYENLDYYNPVKSDNYKFKWMVKVWDPEFNRDRIVYFGDYKKIYYLDVVNSKDRTKYLSRETCDDPLNPEYWIRRWLYISGETWYLNLPPGYEIV